MDLSKSVIGLELGSTRIKAVLLDENLSPAAFGAYEWENELIDGIWTYGYDKIDEGIISCFSSLKADVMKKYGVKLTRVGAIGISGMMHGYIPLDNDLKPLTNFYTWRNNATEAADALYNILGIAIPARWTVSHLFNSIMKKEEHLKELAYLTTLAGYVHLKLTGEFVLGIGEASGVFPIGENSEYSKEMTAKFDTEAGKYGFTKSLTDIIPKIKAAGEVAGYLTESGAKYLDPDGDLLPGIPFAPPEGDADTGMVATNSVKIGTGNVSCGTSDFVMIVTECAPKKNKSINVLKTPHGKDVAMIHCSNCTSDINAWCDIFAEFAELIGSSISKNELYTKLFTLAIKEGSSTDGLLSYNYVSGEALTGFSEGRPLFLRKPTAKLSLGGFMRTHLFSALATLKLGMKKLESEGVEVKSILAHGGYFKTEGVGDSILSAALGCEVCTMKTAGEGGPYGMALLAAYVLHNKNYSDLSSFLDLAAFKDAKITRTIAKEELRAEFSEFTERYEKALAVEKEAVSCV